jgi:opacity protein-like surface antigen
MRRRWTALCAAGALTAAAFVFGEDAEARDFWSGPYVGVMWGTGSGTADYTFNTDGWYNTAPGQTFSAPVSGHPIGGELGYSWQTGRFVYGVNSLFYSAVLGISHKDTPDPFNPDADFDLKGHWFMTLAPRIGVALGRFMVYGEAGPAVGHLGAEADDTTNGYYLWTPGPAFGVSTAIGVEIAATRWVSFGLEYRTLRLGAFHVEGESLDTGTDAPVPGTDTDHDIRYSNRTIMGRLDFHFFPRDSMPVARRAWDADWGGFYVGIFGGALHQAGGAVGYNFDLPGNLLAGVEAQASFDFCCGKALEADVNARIGYVLRDKIWFYAEAGGGFTNGSFYGLLGPGPLYSLGGGMEISLSPRTSAFVELKAVGGPGQGFIDANFQSGLNIHL